MLRLRKGVCCVVWAAVMALGYISKMVFYTCKRFNRCILKILLLPQQAPDTVKRRKHCGFVSIEYHFQQALD